MKVVGEEPEDVTLKVEVVEGKVVQEQRLLGIVKFEFFPWISEIGRPEWKGETFGKFHLYDPALLSRPEFVFPNHLLLGMFSEKERKQLEEVVQRAFVAAEAKAHPVEEKKEQDKGKPKPKPAAKKEAKKTGAKKPAGGKDAQAAVDIEDIEAPDAAPHVLLERNYRLGADAYVAEKQRAVQEDAKKKAEEGKAAGKKKEITEELKQKLKADKKEANIKRMEKYFEVAMSAKTGPGVIVRIRMNNLKPEKKEEPKEEEVAKTGKPQGKVAGKPGAKPAKQDDKKKAAADKVKSKEAKKK